ncbi:MAG: DUF1848 domain-containing protein [Armatimonadota bacterium]
MPNAQPRIISASRRTDIPAYYSSWLVNRLREGYCIVANPFDRSQTYRVDLSPESVDVIVFWTKNAKPLLPYLDEIDKMGFKDRYYFQYTVTCYPPILEPNTPPLATTIRTLSELADRIGPQRIIWRYDPIILTTHTDYAYHHAHFAELAQSLSTFCCRCVISLADLHYRGASERIGRLESQQGLYVLQPDPDSVEFGTLMRRIYYETMSRGLEVVSCAEKLPLERFGIAPGRCVDDAYIARALGVCVPARNDPHQRPKCRCVESRDIGQYSTCPNGCVFCYATQNTKLVERNLKLHNPFSPCLVGGSDCPREHT